MTDSAFEPDSPDPDEPLDAIDEVAPDVPAAGFAALGLDPRLLRTIAALGYEEPTPVQTAAIPPLLAGRDLLAEAPTGTGKTAAFALPMLQALAGRMDAAREAGQPADNRGVPRDGRGSRPTALVLTPTRELAMQVAEAIHKYGRELGARVVPVYGGQPITAQLARLARGVDVVVATPGRAVDHLDRGTLRFEEVTLVVLDEADEMLDMGFADDLDKILSALPKQRQTALFSATIAGQIARLAERHLHDPVRVRVHQERVAAGEAARVRQVAYVVRRPDKLAALGRILDLEDGAATLVFARTREEVDTLAEALAARGRDAAALHGGLAQEQRDRIMNRFRDGALDVLVATDVAARGLDIEKVTHVVNFDVPSSPDIYVHRIGRTGRAGREGVAITLVEPREHRLLRDIERTIGASLEVAGLPTVADLREKRLDMLRSSLRDALVAGGHDRYRAVIEPLEAEFDLAAIALAAIAQADAEARGAEDTTELAPAMLPSAFPQHVPFGRGPVRGVGRRPNTFQEHAPVRPPHQRPFDRPGDWQPQGPGTGFVVDGRQGDGQPFDGRPFDGRPVDGRPQPVRPGPYRPVAPVRATAAGPRKGYRPSGWEDNEGRPILRAPNRGSGGGGVTRLFVGLGRAAGVRPGDLVGAITNEAGLDGRDIGAIQIADGFSLVEVPEVAAEHVIGALRGATIRGRSAMVRRERY